MYDKQASQDRKHELLGRSSSVRDVRGLHKVIKEVLIAVLVARLRQVVFSHDVVVGMISPIGELLALLGDSSFLLALWE